MKFHFKTSGRTLPENQPPSMRKIIATANTLPDGDLLDQRDMAQASRVPFNTLRNHGSVGLDACSVVFQNRRWFGNPKTIAALRKQNA